MVGFAGAGGGELITIKQAAQFLNVSEVSLRRWTDAGRLSCMRVGARRERRFRRTDLLAFLEQQDARPGSVRKAARAGSGRVEIEGIAIDEGDHLCSLYQNDLGRVKLSVPFLANGLRAGEVCYLIAAPDAQAHILGQLGDVYGGTAQAIKEERLVVSEGQASGPEMYAFLERNFVMATRGGGRFLRLVGDMVWALEKGVAVDDLMDFELRYSHTLARRFPIVSLCQYDTRAFSGKAVHDVLTCHEDTFDYPLSRFI